VGGLNVTFYRAVEVFGSTMEELLKGLRRALRRDGEDRAKVRRGWPCEVEQAPKLAELALACCEFLVLKGLTSEDAKSKLSFPKK
jgi:hypothetical protein